MRPPDANPEVWTRAPRLVRWLLPLWLRRDDRREVESDLQELYERLRDRDGEVAARRWLRRQWLQYLVRIVPLRGSRAAFREDAGRGRGSVGGGIESLWLDLRHGARSLARAPGLTVTIVLTVGLGLGATTTVWSVAHAVLLAPLPYDTPERLYRIYTDAPPNAWRLSVADYLALDEQQTSFSAVAGYTQAMVTFSDRDTAERLQAKRVTGRYFSLLGIAAARGRVLEPEDDQPGGALVAVVSRPFAERHLGGEGAAVGASLRLDGREHTVVGVLPARAGPLEQRYDVFLPARWEPPPRKGPFFVIALGRLRDDVDRRAADGELAAINRRIFPLWKASYADERATWATMGLADYVVGGAGRSIGLVAGAVALVLLIAWTNAASLLVARTARRERELAVRGALGASRSQLVRLLVAESLLLSVGAAGVGVAASALAVRLIALGGAADLPRLAELRFSWPAIAFLAAATAATALLFALVPALGATRARLAGALGSGARSTSEGTATRRLRQALVAGQFAVATPLLIASALLTVSLAKLQRVDPGFEPRGLLSASVLLPADRYAAPEQVRAFWQRLEDRVEALPGVEGVAFVDGRPPDGVGNINNFDLEDDPTPAGESEPTAAWLAASPDYFRLLGVQLLAGRLFEPSDAAPEAPEVVVVDRAWARRYFPGEDPLGRRLHEGGSSTWTTVVGVVGEVKYLGLDQPDRGTVYSPLLVRALDPTAERATSRFAYLVVRSPLDPLSLAPPLRRALRELDPELPLEDVATLPELLASSLETPRLLSSLVVGFGASALLLSMVGIYGVTSYFVQQRTREIGIRVALGSGPVRVRRLVVTQGLRVVGAGVAVGLIVGLLVMRLLSSLLFGIGALDPGTFLGVATALVAVALLACAVPARRAAGVDPVVALRSE